jgi:hypothetical protein
MMIRHKKQSDDYDSDEDDGDDGHGVMVMVMIMMMVMMKMTIVMMMMKKMIMMMICSVFRAMFWNLGICDFAGVILIQILLEILLVLNDGSKTNQISP